MLEDSFNDDQGVVKFNSLMMTDFETTYFLAAFVLHRYLSPQGIVLLVDLLALHIDAIEIHLFTVTSSGLWCVCMFPALCMHAFVCP